MQTHTNVIPLFAESYLESLWKNEFDEFRQTRDAEVLQSLKNWSARTKLIETVDEGSLQSIIFKGLLGYSLNGEASAAQAFTMYPQFPVARAGQTGGTGKADLALGWFVGSGDKVEGIPQVLCEFKDGRSGLDTPQNRKGNNRSPVKQCFDYLREASNALYGHEPVRPSWGIVTDMNEFRLYHRSRGPAQYERFFVCAPDEYGAVSMADDTDAGAYQRFLFTRLLSGKMLLARSGKSPLERTLDEQWIREKVLEKEFYLEYDSYRKKLLEAIRTANLDFDGTPGTLVRLTQRLLDRCLFLLFCEDMGAALQFPRDLLRDMLVTYSQDPYYNPDDQVIWDRLRSLFRAMEEGGTFFGKTINRFNGGLFRSEPRLESLRVPTSVFCAQNQGAGSEANLRQHKETLLYFAATYNFGVERHGGEQIIDPYALGRIFEQSITELEIMEADADNRESINKLSKRKRDGVYYTPERVTAYIVQETVGARCEDLKREAGLADLPVPTVEDVALYRTHTTDKQRNASAEGIYLEALRGYERRLDTITVLDPACGSGAFLVQAFDFLCRERRWISAERERITGKLEIWDIDSVYKSALSNNIYGVDINPESVEITRLALWLHTALPGRQLTSLDANIQCGNSLVGADFADFYRRKHQTLFSDVDERERERINAFDWEHAFPDVFARGGFDCVVGNPPYVKLQNFRKVEPDVAEYLVEAGSPDGGPLYASTRTGNFDLYLPFIEKGIALMNPEGRMGYIAPSLWTKNEYGKGLRSLLKESHALDRWIDFGHHQIFDEAITYTSLQFFRASPSEPVRCAFSHDGDISAVDWAAPAAKVSYQELPVDDPWYLLPDEERRLIARLLQSNPRLADPRWTEQIFQGLITSADPIYHLRRTGDGRYVQTLKEKGNKKPVEITVEIEDEIMHPLVSGAEAKRYQRPLTDTYILFPYDISGTTPRLFSETEMQTRFPKAWAYLTENLEALRGRESGAFDDLQWYRFGRHQSIDKQTLPKLGVAQTVPGMRVFFDDEGSFYFNNVRVNGILPQTPEDGWYLLGILNSYPCDFVFRRIGKSKEGGFFEANKQFIAPLPIPVASDEQRSEVVRRAQELQELHTRLRDEGVKLDKRLDSSSPAPRTASWIWPELRENAAAWKADAPPELSAKEKTAWAKERHATELATRIDQINERLRPGISLVVAFDDGELLLGGNGAPIIDGIYLDDDEGTFIAAQWRQFVRGFNATDGSGKRLLDRLLAIRSSANPALRNQVIEIDRRMTDLEQTISGREREMNEIVYGLYNLSEDERRIIERG